MLWKRHLSIYTSGNPKSTDHKRQSSKARSSLAPLISVPNSSSAMNTIDSSTNPKFLIRKKSKSSKMIKEQIPNTFFIHRGNNFQLVKSIFEEAGYVQTVSKEASCLIWYQGKDLVKRDLARKDLASKICNYFPNHGQLTNKQFLYENLIRYDPDCVGKFVPRTFVIDFKESLAKVESNLMLFMVEFFRKSGMSRSSKKGHSLCITNFYGEICILYSRILKMLYEETKEPINPQERVNINSIMTDNLWIVKPAFLNRGQGIEIINNLKQLQKILGQDSQQISIRMYQPEEVNTPSSYVIQEYITNPLLYKGYKFDIRVWILLRKTKKDGLQVYLYEKGYARLAGHKYLLKQQTESPEPKRSGEPVSDKKMAKSIELSPGKNKKGKRTVLNDPYIHLTNNSVQKNCKQYGEVHEGNQILIEELIEAIGNDNFTRQVFFGHLKKIIKVMIESTKEKLLAKANYGTFQIMGLDFMIDTAYKIWLIEANCNPCLEETSAILKQILPKMLKEVLEVIQVERIMGGRTSTQADSQKKRQQDERNQWERIY